MKNSISNENLAMKAAMDIQPLRFNLQEMADDRGKPIDELSLADVVKEAEFVYSCFFEEGHALHEARTGKHGSDRQTEAEKDVKSLVAFLRKHKPAALKSGKPAPAAVQRKKKKSKEADAPATPGTMASALLTASGKLPVGCYLETGQVVPASTPASETLFPLGDQPTIGNLGTPVEVPEEPPAELAGGIPVEPLATEEPRSTPAADFLARYTDQEIIEEFQRRGLCGEALTTVAAMVSELAMRKNTNLQWMETDHTEIPEEEHARQILSIRLKAERETLLFLADKRRALLNVVDPLKKRRTGSNGSTEQRAQTRAAWSKAKELATAAGKTDARYFMKEAWALVRAGK